MGEQRGGPPGVVGLRKSHCDSGEPRDGAEGSAGRWLFAESRGWSAWASVPERPAPAGPQTGEEGLGSGTRQRSVHAGRKIDLRGTLSGSSEGSCPVRSHPGRCSLQVGIHAVPTGDKNFLRGLLPWLQTSSVILNT